MPYLKATREPRKIRLLRLALLQIAILTTVAACGGGYGGGGWRAV